MIDKNKILEAVKKVKASDKRNFTQSVDIAINLKDVDTSKDQLEEFIVLPHGRGKPAKVCAFVGAELKSDAEKFCDEVILSDNFSKWDDKRKCRKLARRCDFFIAQINIMPTVAKTFGQFLGTVGKMPNPKAGHIVPPKADLKPIVENLRNVVKVVMKKAPVIHCSVGNEVMPDEHITENILAILDKVQTKLPVGEHNIKDLIIKKTMGKLEVVR